MDNLPAALEYLSRGWSIFPLTPGRKHPCIKSWTAYQERLPTEDEVREWWTRWPDANIGMVCGRISGVVVVDVDPQHGGNMDGLPPTGCITRTGQGGAHFIYAYPPDGNGNIVNQVNGADHPDPPRRGRDVRADGGYIILPPSDTSQEPKGGGRYSWRKWEPSTLQSPPSWAVTPWVQLDEDGKREKWLADLIANGTRVGQRNDDLARFAGYLAKKQLPLDVALAIARSWMVSQNNPLHSSEVEVTVRSVYKTEQRKNPDRPKTKEQRSIFRTHTLNQFMLKYGDHEIRWTVDQWLPESTVGFIVSPPGGFKTWMTFDLAVSVASGKPYLGQYQVSNPGPVLVVQQEDFNTQTAERNALIMLSRLRMKQPHASDDGFDIPVMPTDRDLPLHFHAERLLRFDDREIMDAVAEYVKEVRPRLVIVDPFYSTVAADEYMMRAAGEMSILKKLRDDYGTSFMLVHHTNKTQEWGRMKMWGSQFLNAFSETSWHIRRPEGEDFNVTQRNFKAAGVQPFLKLAFDIDVSGYGYRVDVEEISKEDAERIVAGKTDTPTREAMPKGIGKSILEALTSKPDGLTIPELALLVGSDSEKVAAALRRLVQRGDVREDAAGRWTHAVPSFV